MHRISSNKAGDDYYIFCKKKGAIIQGIKGDYFKYR